MSSAKRMAFWHATSRFNKQRCSFVAVEISKRACWLDSLSQTWLVSSSVCLRASAISSHSCFRSNFSLSTAALVEAKRLKECALECYYYFICMKKAFYSLTFWWVMWTSAVEEAWLVVASILTDNGTEQHLITLNNMRQFIILVFFGNSIFF